MHTTLEANLLPCAFYCRVGWAFCESTNKKISKLKRTRGAGQYGNCNSIWEEVHVHMIRKFHSEAADKTKYEIQFARLTL